MASAHKVDAYTSIQHFLSNQRAFTFLTTLGTSGESRVGVCGGAARANVQECVGACAAACVGWRVSIDRGRQPCGPR